MRHEILHTNKEHETRDPARKNAKNQFATSRTQLTVHTQKNYSHHLIESTYYHEIIPPHPPSVNE